MAPEGWMKDFISTLPKGGFAFVVLFCFCLLFCFRGFCLFVFWEVVLKGSVSQRGRPLWFYNGSVSSRNFSAGSCFQPFDKCDMDCLHSYFVSNTAYSCCRSFSWLTMSFSQTDPGNGLPLFSHLCLYVPWVVRPSLTTTIIICSHVPAPLFLVSDLLPP